MKGIELIEKEIKDLRSQLVAHTLYKKLASIDDIRLFMQHHVFAVWDFMSLLKALQQHLTHLNTPWIPATSPTLARFINEIVWAEESDINEAGEPKSHFEMYLDAMNQAKADTSPINAFIDLIRQKVSVNEALERLDLPASVKEFVRFTFEVIATNKPHLIAAVFTFGREELIPDMFIEIVNNAENDGSDEHAYNKLIYYLNRHIELDGDEHGPLSLQMVEQLCGNDTTKWNEVIAITKKALQQRIKLWDGVAEVLPNPILIS